MLDNVLLMVAEELEENMIPYMVLGYHEVFLNEKTRVTRDIDVTLGIAPDEYEEIEKIVEKLSLEVLVDNPEEIVRNATILPLLDKESEVRIFFIFSSSPYEKQAIERTIPMDLNGGQVNFASLEDLVIHKLIAGSSEDIEEVEKLILENPDYERDYIYRWLERIDESMEDNLTDTFKEIEDRYA